MQRLLRGWWFYLLLGLVTLALHLNAISPRPTEAPHLSPALSRNGGVSAGSPASLKLRSGRSEARRAKEEKENPRSHGLQPVGRGSRSSAEWVGTASPPAKTEVAKSAVEWWPEESDLALLQQAAEREPWLGVSVLMLGMLVLGMALGGLGLTIWGLLSGRARRLWPVRARRIPLWSLGELSRIVILIALIASLFPFIRMFVLCLFYPGWALRSRVWVAMATLLLDLFVVFTILSFAAAKGLSILRTLGVSTRTLRASIRSGLQGYAAIFPWLLMLLALTVAIARRFGMEPPSEPIQELIFEEQAPSILWLTVLLACVVGPLAEELFFRGVLYAAIRRCMPRIWAMLISAAFFSLMHTNIIGFVPVLLLGCLLAERYERTGSLAAPIAVHILHNSLLMSLALIFRHATQMS